MVVVIGGDSDRVQHSGGSRAYTWPRGLVHSAQVTHAVRLN